ncbi:hypothetical protein SCUP234_06808 [Seiridium cupressi]
MMPSITTEILLSMLSIVAVCQAQLGRREGPYWLHVTSSSNTSIDGYAFLDPDSSAGAFTYDPRHNGHDVRLRKWSHFMLYQTSNSTDYTAINLLSYSKPGLDVPEPEDPNPGAAYLRFQYTLQSTLARALFAHYEENNTWPIQSMALGAETRQLGYIRKGDLLDLGGSEEEFVSFWYICWVRCSDAGSSIWSAFFWSPAQIPSDQDCTPVQISLEAVVK